MEKPTSQPCPLCSSTKMAGTGRKLVCQACGTAVTSFRAFSFAGPMRFRLERVPDDYKLLGSSLAGRALDETSLKKVAALAYRDKELAEIAAGRLEALKPAADMYSTVIFEQLHENIRLHLKNIWRGWGEALSGGSNFIPQESIKSGGDRPMERGNLLITDQRLIFTASTYTFIRLDRKLSAVTAYQNGLTLQRQGEKEAICFTGLLPIEAALAAAIIMGTVPYLKEGGGTLS